MIRSRIATPFVRIMFQPSFASLFVLLLVALSTNLAGALKDPATGISFPAKANGLEIFGVGVRRKGPIKVYSVAAYGTDDSKKALSAMSRSKSEKQALAALQSEAKSDKATFLLEMSFKIGAEKMANAIAESVAPRHKGSSKDVDDLKDIIFKGVDAKGAATKGTTFQFDCSAKSGVTVSVDGKEQGHVSSPGLASAFCDVYLDDKCVSPPLRTSCLENCCAP